MKFERQKDFKRNKNLEDLIQEINSILVPSENRILEHYHMPKFPVIFIVGCARAGSTIMLQWLANTGQFAYPTNLISRFYATPYIGAKIQQLLTDSRFNFRDELSYNSMAIEYISDLGKTQGVLSPNEFWYFWRRFFHYGEIQYLDDEALKKLEPVMGICFKNDLPIMIHTNESLGHNYAGKTPVTLDQIYKLIKSFPENKIVLAHWGGGIFFYNLLKREMKNTLKNTYFDTAASPFLYDSNVYRFAMDIVGREKILFGTDYPLLNPARYFKEFESIGLEENDLEYICGKNAAALLKI